MATYTTESLTEEFHQYLEEKKGLAALGAAGLIAAGGAHYMNKDASAADSAHVSTWEGPGDPHQWGEGDWFYEPGQETPTDHPGEEEATDRQQTKPTKTSSGAASYSKRDLDLLAMTIWGEARSVGKSGMGRVANVIINRKNHESRWGNSIESVVKQDKHFSAWNEGDVNLEQMKKMQEYYDYLSARPRGSDEWLERFKNSKEYPDFLIYMQAREVAAKALSGRLRDQTNGALFYHTRAVAPSWSKGQEVVAQDSGHVFFKTDRKA